MLLPWTPAQVQSTCSSPLRALSSPEKWNDLPLTKPERKTFRSVCRRGSSPPARPEDALCPELLSLSCLQRVFLCNVLSCPPVPSPAGTPWDQVSSHIQALAVPPGWPLFC
ncbi:hypothetical protein H1C71_018562 [Ictidomys tridecemlineatus]|nr:hypothetical protein H1C71_018562 [Ictidomys tridecemlineatus]